MRSLMRDPFYRTYLVAVGVFWLLMCLVSVVEGGLGESPAQRVIIENTSPLAGVAQVVAIIAGCLAILGGMWASYRWLKKNYSINKRT